ncbi:lipid II-degrading bacteriocin [Pseudomonas nunensis]|uniref:lipid II-degrading bacteriocin n=1 Tax=Pseudomonas nunensis TaxID=2961896 RepID=UPI0025B118EF|nr:lipid II-degrading bacteriocin [Pseudomonas nunensis]MDN3219096.1 lipid II-degrading bacteriocin [Pseudomonas nunensis]
MKNGLTLPPIVTKGTTGNSGGFTINPGFSWGTYATADWQGAGEAMITNDGRTYSLPLCDGPVITPAEMDMFHEWLEMKSGIKAFTYELQMLGRTINNNDALGAIKDLWKITEGDNYLLNNASIVTHAYFKNKLISFSLADAFAAQQKLSDRDALIRVAATNPYSIEYKAMTPELSGGPFSPVKAFAHYLWGKGEKLRVDINNIGLNVRPHEIPLLANTIASTRAAGTYHLSDPKVPYATINDNIGTGAYLGRITLKVEGDFTRNENGSWIFDGTAKAYTDTYDFDESNRSTFLEVLTTAGRVFSGASYEIDISGEHKIMLNGTGFQPNPH